VFSRKLKGFERIESPKKNVDLLKECDFIVLEENIYDFDNFLDPYFKKPNNFKISKALKIEYFPKGSISVYDNYIDKENFNTNLLTNLSDIKNIDLSKLKLCNSVCINESKKGMFCL
jgi:hypothetical protein